MITLSIVRWRNEDVCQLGQFILGKLLLVNSPVVLMGSLEAVHRLLDSCRNWGWIV